MKLYTKQIDGRAVIKPRNQIVLRVTEEISGEMQDFQIINPTEEMILADGWVEYVAPPQPAPTKSRLQIVQELVIKDYNNRTDVSNEEALEYMAIIYPWEYYLGQTLEVGMMVVYEDKPWRVRQAHTVQEIYPPSINTASLYEAIDKEHSGTEDDPIPYTIPMEVFEGKYYIESGKVYRCIRDSGTALTHSPSVLIGHYFEEV